MSKKPGVLSNLSSGIDKKTRFVLLGVISVIVVITYMFFGGSSGEPKVKGPAGSAQLGGPPSSNNIDKIKIGEKLDVPENSPIAKQIEQGRADKIEEVRNDTTSSTSYMDQLKLENETMIQKKIEEKRKVKTTKVVKTGIDDIMKKKKEQMELEKKKREAEAVKVEIKKPTSTQPAKAPIQQQQQVEKKEVVTRAMLLDAFLEEEKVNSKYTDDSITRSFERLAGSSNTFGKSISIKPQNNDANANSQNAPNNAASNNQVSSTQPQYNDSVSTIQEREVYDVVPGEQMYGIILNSINSDEDNSINPVLVQIVDGGILEGAKLVGQFQFNEESESLTLGFNTLTLDGQVYDVGAVAVDLTDDGTSLADSVDRHIIERYGSLALAAFMDGYAQAMTSSSTVTNADGTSTTTSSAIPDPADQFKAAVGNVGTAFVPVLQNKFDRPSTVTVNGGRAIGVLFLKPFNVE